MYFAANCQNYDTCYIHHQYTHRENMPECYSQADCPGQVRSSCCICETCSTHTNVMFHGWSEFWHAQVFARIANRLMFDICRTNNYSFESLSSTKRFTETNDSTPANEDIATRVPTTTRVEESPGEWPEDTLDLQIIQILHERIALYVSAVYTLQLTTIKRIHDKVIKILSDIHAPGNTWSEFWHTQGNEMMKSKIPVGTSCNIFLEKRATLVRDVPFPHIYLVRDGRLSSRDSAQLCLGCVDLADKFLEGWGIEEMVHIAMLCSFFITYLREESPGEWPEDVLDLQIIQILHERIALYVSAVYTPQLTTISRNRKCKMKDGATRRDDIWR